MHAVEFCKIYQSLSAIKCHDLRQQNTRISRDNNENGDRIWQNHSQVQSRTWALREISESMKLSTSIGVRVGERPFLSCVQCPTAAWFRKVTASSSLSRVEEQPLAYSTLNIYFALVFFAWRLQKSLGNCNYTVTWLT